MGLWYEHFLYWAVMTYILSNYYVTLDSYTKKMYYMGMITWDCYLLVDLFGDYMNQPIAFFRSAGWDSTWFNDHEMFGEMCYNWLRIYKLSCLENSWNFYRWWLSHWKNTFWDQDINYPWNYLRSMELQPCMRKLLHLPGKEVIGWFELRALRCEFVQWSLIEVVDNGAFEWFHLYLTSEKRPKSL